MRTKEALDEPLCGLLGNAARAIGTDQFHRRLLDALKTVGPWDAVNIVRWSRYAAPDFLYSERFSKALIERYMQGYYRFDPFFRWWRDAGEGGVLTLSAAMRPADAKGTYFTEFFPLVEMSDIIGMYLPSIAHTSIALYLEIREKRFSKSVIDRMERLYPLFLGLHDAHIAHTIADLRFGRGALDTNRALVVLDRDRRVIFASPAWQEAANEHVDLRDPMALALAIVNKDQLLTSAGALFVEPLTQDSLLAPEGTILVLERRAPAQTPNDFDEAFATFAKGKLTPRETQISRLMIAGYPTEAIAKTLGIGRGTVKNHRRRLYDRLDITTERELFSLFLEYLANPSGGAAAASTSAP
jgi:DNA-binding CsgD family transcriptional regulator